MLWWPLYLWGVSHRCTFLQLVLLSTYRALPDQQCCQRKADYKPSKSTDTPGTNSRNVFSCGFLGEDTLSGQCLQGLYTFKGFIDCRFSFKVSSLVLFLQNTFHFSLISMKLIGEAGSKERNIFIDLMNSSVFVWRKNTSIWLFFLEQLHRLKMFFKYIWGGMEKHTKMAIFKTSKAVALSGLRRHTGNILGIVSLLQPVSSAKAARDNTWCFEWPNFSWLINLDTVFRMNKIHS